MNRSVLLVLGLLLSTSGAMAQEYDFRKLDCRKPQFWIEVMQEMNKHPVFVNESLQVVDVHTPQHLSVQKSKIVCKAIFIFSDLDEVPMKVSLYVGHLGHPIYEWEPSE